MIQTLTDANGTLYRSDRVSLMVEDSPTWVTLGYLDGRDALVVDNFEWDTFVEMVNQVDAARKVRAL